MAFGDDLLDYGLSCLATGLRASAAADGYEEIGPEEEAVIARARTDFHTFVEYVYRDEFQQVIRQAPFHRELHDHVLRHQRALVLMPNEHGKSVQMRARCTWKLGRRPESTAIGVLMAEADKAMKTTIAVKRDIETNVRLHRVFPALRKGDLWRQKMLNVAGHNDARCPSMQAFGVWGQINGDRLSDIEMDDMLTGRNVLSALQCARTIDFVSTEVISRVLSCPKDRDGNILCPACLGEGDDFHLSNNVVLSGHPWTRHDIIADWQRKAGIAVFKRRLINCGLDEIRNPKPDTRRKILWPERWSLQRVQQTLEDQGELAFLRTKQMEAGDPSKRRFRDRHIARALLEGLGLSIVDRFTAQSGDRPAFGLDLAHADELAENDFNGIFGWLLRGRRYRMLCLELDEDGRWSEDEWVQRLDGYAERFTCAPGARWPFVCESNYGQKFFARFTNKLSKASIVSSFTGAEKRHHEIGVDGIALSMERGQVQLPAAKAKAEGLESVDCEFSEHEEGDRDIIRRCRAAGVIAEQDATGRVVARFWVHVQAATFVASCRAYEPDGRHIPDALAAAWKAFHYLGGAPAVASFAVQTGAARAATTTRMGNPRKRPGDGAPDAGY